MTDLMNDLGAMVARLDSRFPVPRPIDEVSAELGVRVIRPQLGTARAEGWVRDAVQTFEMAGIKDGLFLPRPHPMIVVARSEGQFEAWTRRQRFTWAHELAHYLVWRATGVVPGSDYWQHEQACDWFAGEFLVPARIIAAVAGRPGRDWLGGVDRVSRACMVSWEVASGCMTAQTNGRLVFVRLALSGSRLKVSGISTKHFYRAPVGRNSFLDEPELLKMINDPPATGHRSITLQSDIGQLATGGQLALVRRRGKRLEMMVRMSAVPTASTLGS